MHKISNRIERIEEVMGMKPDKLTLPMLFQRILRDESFEKEELNPETKKLIERLCNEENE